MQRKRGPRQRLLRADEKTTFVGERQVSCGVEARSGVQYSTEQAESFIVRDNNGQALGYYLVRE